MAREIPPSKRLDVVKLYFEGLTYDEIARRVGIGKGSVAAIAEELRTGRFPQFEHLTDLVNGLRDLAVGLGKAGINLAEAALLSTLTKRLLALGVEPALLEAWVRMCQSVPEGELLRSQIIPSATKLAKLEGEGISYEEAVERLNSASGELKELEEKVAAVRTKLAQLEESRQALAQACQGLESDKKRLEVEGQRMAEKAQGLAGRCRELEKEAEGREAALSGLAEREKEVGKRLPHLEERATALEKELADRAQALKALEEVGFSRNDLEQLRARLTEMVERHGKEGLAARFFGHLESYESLLGIEAARDCAAREVQTLTKQRDSLTRLGGRAGLTPDEVMEAAGAIKSLCRKGVPLLAIVSYAKLLTSAGADHQSFQKLVEEYERIEKVLAAKGKDLEGLMQQLDAKGRALDRLKAEEARVRESITTLRDSGVREIESMGGSAKAEVEKLCRGLHHDISRWGEMRAEMGKSQEELKLARYFAKLPLSEEALSALVEEMGTPVVLQYLIAALTWCRKKFNPKLRPPSAMIKKYYRIGDYTEVELADILMWALLVFMEGVGSDQGRI